MDARVLLVTSRREDAGLLSRMLAPGLIEFEHVSSVRDARSTLARESYGAILTEAYLGDGTWKDVLDLTEELGIRPAVVVTHRFADDRFWAEVLNLGCYDMLAQPFDAGEVQRILTLACSQVPAKPAACAPSAADPLTAAV
jgi:DNA-binding NtrC family response regulator